MTILTKNVTVKLYPNSHMKKYLNTLFGYRRYCWNQALATWNEQYEVYTLNPDNNVKPSEYGVRNELVANKQDWQYALSSRVLQQASIDLGNTMQQFFNKTGNYPKFKSKRERKQSFKTDRAKIVDNKLRLDKAHGFNKNQFYDIRMSKVNCDGDLVLTAVRKVGKHYFATLCFKNCHNKVTTFTNKKTAVDVNVSHLNYTDGQVQTLNPRIEQLYQRVNVYQRKLARKCVDNPTTFNESNKYLTMRTKLLETYRKITCIQGDILHKFTKQLVSNYDKIVIEDLQVHSMMMSHVASKGMQRSAFAKFRQLLTYKCDWYGKQLILADKTYPSTQLCSRCGYRKTGDNKITLAGNSKHHTKHNEFICYNCGHQDDRDHNAVMNLLKLA